MRKNCQKLFRHDEKVLRFLDNFERVNEDTKNDLLGEKSGYIVSYQVYGI